MIECKLGESGDWETRWIFNLKTPVEQTTHR